MTTMNRISAGSLPPADVHEHLLDLLTMTVHDLRGPLTCALGNVTLVLDSISCSETDRELLRRADHCLRAMDQLVASILDLRRLEVGRMPLQVSDCSLATLVEEAVGAFVADPVDRDRIRLTVPPDLRVACDCAVIRRVIGNLVVNALKFSPAEATVQVSAAKRGTAVRVEVEDHGVGIPHRFRKHLFQRFSQAAPGRVGVSGVGLGLAFCRLAVESHGGQLEVESRPGWGTKLSFELPAHAPQTLPSPS